MKKPTLKGRVPREAPEVFDAYCRWYEGELGVPGAPSDAGLRSTGLVIVMVDEAGNHLRTPKPVPIPRRDVVLPAGYRWEGAVVVKVGLAKRTTRR